MAPALIIAFFVMLDGSAMKRAVVSLVTNRHFENALVTGGWILGTRPVDLKQVSIPALVISASTDHIAPPAACGGLEAAWGGPCDLKTLRGGHVGICVGKTLPATLIEWSLGES
jgi:putative long chain acyl-CoA synthase